MDAKINSKNKTADAGLRYQYGAGGDITVLYQGYRLIFSAGLKNLALKQGGMIKSVDLYGLFSKNAKQAWQKAVVFAKKRESLMVSEQDLFLALLDSPSVKNMLQRMKVSIGAAETLVKNYSELQPPKEAESAGKIPFEAFLLAAKLHNHKIGSLMLLGALLKTAPRENILQAIFANIELSLEKLELFSAWILDLDFDFPKNSPYEKLLYCCRQAKALEEHFKYFFEFPAIERAVALSDGQTLKGLEHKKALQLLVKAAGLAKAKGEKIISENLVKQAAA